MINPLLAPQRTQRNDDILTAKKKKGLGIKVLGGRTKAKQKHKIISNSHGKIIEGGKIKQLLRSLST